MPAASRGASAAAPERTTVRTGLPQRVLVADDEHLVASSLASTLTDLGVEVIGPANNGREAIVLAEQGAVDMALVDIRMPEMDGLEAAGILFHRLGVPAVIVSAFSDDEYVQQGSRIGVFGYMLKPVTSEELRAALAVAWARFGQHLRLRGELDDLKTALEDRKIIERAKGMLMDRLLLKEAEAMRRLQKQARDTRRKLPDVARAIIESDELFRSGSGYQ